MKKIPLMLAYLSLSALLALPFCLAQEDWHHSSKSLVLDLSVTSNVDLVPTNSDHSITYLSVNLSHIPYTTFNQQILKYSTYPTVADTSSNLIFRWEKPQGSVSFGYDATIQTNNEIIQIPKRIAFPIRQIPEELRPYIENQENIDSNDPKIAALASSLVDGQNDLYGAVFAVADWTQTNIAYDLSSLTADVSQKASWVLDNRQGVCDELTSLFIAMLRSVGIPAKFVSGVAYTNSELFSEGWGSHGWAEVYFPGIGWVPFDVTYGQFGYIDPTHIKLKESLDSGDPSVQYNWLAKGIEIKTQQLEVAADVEEKKGTMADPLKLEVVLLGKKVGFGSYNLIEVIIENTAPYYVSTQLYLSRPKELELFENAVKTTYLRPLEKKSVFWMIEIPPDLERNYVYTFPLTVSTRLGSANAELTSQRGEITYSKDEVESILNQRIEQEKKTYSRDVLVDCYADKESYYSYEDNIMHCFVKNVGNSALTNVEVCLKHDCQKLDLGISQEKAIDFELDLVEGKQSVQVSVAGKDISKAEYLDVSVLDVPHIVIKDITYPKQVSFDSEFTLEFLLEHDSLSKPNNIDIIVSQDNFKTTWYLEELDAARRIVVNLKGSDLKKGANHFSIQTKYKDLNSKEYESLESFELELVDVNIFENIYLMANGLVQRLEQQPLERVVLYVIGAFIIFVVMIYFVFRRR